MGLIADLFRRRPVAPRQPFDVEGYVLGRGPAPGVVAGYNRAALDRQAAHLQRLLGAERMVFPRTAADAAAADAFLFWGLDMTAGKQRHEALRAAGGQPRLYVEDGFLRSVGIGLSGEPGLSIILDDVTPYYDATRPSRLETVLQSADTPDEAALRRAGEAIAAIRRHRLSKYNAAPDGTLEGEGPAVLLVDQREGDASVRFGGGSADAFAAMCADAARLPADTQVFVKIHPDALTGGKGSYLGPLLAEGALRRPGVTLVDYDINPHALLDRCDEVWTVTSGLGFEALMAARRVTCYGTPYYAGWGATTDRVAVPRRTRRRSVDELFHYAWIVFSRYCLPEAGGTAPIEDVIAHLAAARPGGAGAGR